MIYLTDEDARYIYDQVKSLPVSVRVFDLLEDGSPAPADPDVTTDRCTCNQIDADRDHGHQRGDLGVCRDAIDVYAG